MSKPINSYGHYVNRTSQENSQRKYVNGVLCYFSYSTIVAFKQAGSLTVCQNVWSTTTGKHLNLIDGGSRESRKARLPYPEFLNKLSAAMGA